MACEVGEEAEDLMKYRTVCKTKESSFTIATNDIRLARDLGEWAEANKLKVTDFRKEQNEIPSNIITIQFGKRTE
jgi:predicted nucleotidyltransferase